MKTPALPVYCVCMYVCVCGVRVHVCVCVCVCVYVRHKARQKQIEKTKLAWGSHWSFYMNIWLTRDQKQCEGKIKEGESSHERTRLGKEITMANVLMITAEFNSD